MKTTLAHQKHPKVLVIDIGGSNVKFAVFGSDVKRKFKSGPSLTPGRMVKEVLAATRDWQYDVISIGFPGPVHEGKPVGAPKHLGRGWAGFDYRGKFKKPVKLINDAAMQALGSYTGGRMLFIGLGTGFGSAFISQDILIPLELCNLPYTDGKSIEDFLCKESLKMIGKQKWQVLVHDVVEQFKASFITDYIVIGGGNAKHLVPPLPKGVKLGHNENALLGGYRLWNVKPGRHRKFINDAWVVA